MHESNAVIDSIELIPLGQSDLSPMLENVKIKVFYLGTNRNGSYIDKPTALNMAKTLRGCPIVGCFKEDKGDFIDHGEVVTIDDTGVHFNCVTKPYGFVDLNAEIWFENYIDTDDFGNGVERTYLVTQGTVWTGQFPEIKQAIREGRPHSMELDEETIQGHWTENYKSNMQIFIINDAIFSKLCILGEDVEPCFEGSSVTAPEVSAHFTKDTAEFTKTLYSMMKELKALTYSLNEQGGKPMTAETVQNNVPNSAPENFSNEQDKNVSQVNAENNNITGEFKKEEPKDDKKDPSKDKEPEKKEEGNSDDSSKKEEPKEDEDKDKKPASKNSLETDNKYAELEAKFTELSEKYSALEVQNTELLSFKHSVEDKEKDALIAQFYMLSDEDKKDVIENKSKYSLDDIEAKLSVICVRKKVTFDNGANKEEAPATTFNLNSLEMEDDLPAWLRAVENYKNR